MGALHDAQPIERRYERVLGKMLVEIMVACPQVIAPLSTMSDNKVSINGESDLDC